MGGWLTQINSIIKIFCAICGVRSDVKEALAETAEEIINLLNQINLSETHVVCELKSHTDKRHEAKAVKKVLKLMKRHKLTDRAVYITFSPEATREFVKHAPKGTEVYYLNGNWTPQQLKDEGCAGLDYSLAVMKKHPEWIEQCHNLGLKVNIWTVNRRDDLQWCIDHGADFITTNDPLLLQQMIK